MKTILVAGALANRPLNGGGAWVRLSWLLGLKKLGFQVYFIERIAPESCVDRTGAKTSFQDCVNRRYFAEVVARFELDGAAALICGDGAEVHGASLSDLSAVCQSAAALLNISGHLTVKPLMDALRRKVFIDIDPGFTQFWHAAGNPGARLDGHTDFFTIGENIGHADCPIPTCGIHWRPVRQPVVLEDWPIHRHPQVGTRTPRPSPRSPIGEAPSVQSRSPAARSGSRSMSSASSSVCPR